MNMTDPVADLLARLRNALSAAHERTDVPASRLKREMLRILKQEGFIENFKLVEEGGRSSLRVYLKYDTEGEPLITGLERVSRPGRRVYRAAEEIPEVLGGMGIAIVSTSRGLMTSRDARKEHVGGEVLANFW
jgi:small subunit ribosomal protein S8